MSKEDAGHESLFVIVSLNLVQIVQHLLRKETEEREWYRNLQSQISPDSIRTGISFQNDNKSSLSFLAWVMRRRRGRGKILPAIFGKGSVYSTV